MKRDEDEEEEERKTWLDGVMKRNRKKVQGRHRATATDRDGCDVSKFASVMDNDGLKTHR